MDQLTMQFVIIIGFVAVMYFFMIKPNKKRQQEIMKMRENIKQGDSVITIGGIKGKVIEVTDTDVVIETSSDRTKMEFIKSAIHSVTMSESVTDSDNDSSIEQE